MKFHTCVLCVNPIHVHEDDIWPIHNLLHKSNCGKNKCSCNINWDQGDLVMRKHILFPKAPRWCPPFPKKRDLVLFKLVNLVVVSRLFIRVVWKVTMLTHLQNQGDECEEVENVLANLFQDMVMFSKLENSWMEDHKFKITTWRLWASCMVWCKQF